MCIWQGKGSGRPCSGELRHIVRTVCCVYTMLHVHVSAASGRAEHLQCCWSLVGLPPLKCKGISLVGRFPWTKLANGVCWQVWEFCLLSWEVFLEERMLSKICSSMLTPSWSKIAVIFPWIFIKAFFILKNTVEILLLISVYALSCNIFFSF